MNFSLDLGFTDQRVTHTHTHAHWYEHDRVIGTTEVAPATRHLLYTRHPGALPSTCPTFQMYGRFIRFVGTFLFPIRTKLIISRNFGQSFNTRHLVVRVLLVKPYQNYIFSLRFSIILYFQNMTLYANAQQVITVISRGFSLKKSPYTPPKNPKNRKKSK